MLPRKLNGTEISNRAWSKATEIGMGTRFGEENKRMFQDFLPSHFSSSCSICVRKSVWNEIICNLTTEDGLGVLGTMNSATGVFAGTYFKRTLVHFCSLFFKGYRLETENRDFYWGNASQEQRRQYSCLHGKPAKHILACTLPCERNMMTDGKHR